MSFLIFEGAPTGYVEAERLHNHFIKEGRDKDARWTPFDERGISKLYGFIASKKDMDSFNHHSKDRSTRTIFQGSDRDDL
ncbi:hypothetical protein MKW98_019868 [Papaver atlanticum]|uniref:XS domain-containing protein n=1 Tax=Papaver atlanticum TaxID=357466 RepID=A0AAD4S0S3_9MAGN|nr:hypothetical protein MKW98_019868 [Papaver atlanticum]